MTWIEILLTLTFSIFLTGFALLTFFSFKERHRRAARLGVLFSLLTALCYIVVLLIPQTAQLTIGFILGAALCLVIVLFLWPVKQEITSSTPPNARVDERTIMFSRARLAPGTERYENYYHAQPEHKHPDDRFRRNPGLLQPGSAFFDPRLAASARADFFLTESLRDAVEGPVALQQVNLPPKQAADWVKGLAHYHGALDVGICTLQPYHIYSHIGRGSGTYGEAIHLDHKFAIAFAVEMSHEMINAAPKMPAVIESARQYVEAAKIAIALAAAIRELGYPARAHIDGNYRVIAPLIANDAGLGEIGRMGILMTPKLGPRVRLGIVTTDLPLLVNQAAWDPTVIDFCNHCQKCAEVCPSQALPFGERTQYPDGTLRWKIDPERCYTYWTKVGTDCGRCMAVCPYAHADNIFHNIIRYGVSHSANFRRAASAMDDFFYGRKPAPHPVPDWLQEE